MQKHKKGTPRGAYLFLVCVGLFGGDHIVIDRLTAGKQGDLGVGTALGKELEGLLGLLLTDILAVEDVDKLGALLGLGLRQTVSSFSSLRSVPKSWCSVRAR